MWRAAIMITLALCATGCGERVRDAVKSSASACPGDTEQLTAPEVIGPVPRRYEVLPPDRPKPIERYMAGIRREMGPGYRGHDTRVIYRRGALEGTVVVVLNLGEGRPEDFVAGFEEGAREEGVQDERLEIDGREGRLAPSGDDSYTATAPSGRCAVVILISVDEAKLREAASLIGARS
jgi:hypothetical protein